MKNEQSVLSSQEKLIKQYGVVSNVYFLNGPYCHRVTVEGIPLPKSPNKTNDTPTNVP